MKTICSVLIAIATFMVFETHAASCNRNAIVHQQRAGEIMQRLKFWGQAISVEDEDFLLCMLTEREDKDYVKHRAQALRGHELKRQREFAEAQRRAEIERNRPRTAADCAGDNRPCGNRCYNPLSGQVCANGKVICTPEGQQRLLCSRNADQVAAEEAAAAKIPKAQSAAQECEQQAGSRTGDDRKRYLAWCLRGRALLAGKSQGALPLKDGRYARADVPCEDAPQSAIDVISQGRPVFSPQFGACTIGVEKATETMYTVSARCNNGAPPALVYIIERSTEFMVGSNRMRWCGPR